MPLSYYCCTHCGFWQRYFAPPPDCPDCLDYRHPLPPNGWRFRTPEEVAAQTATRWAEVRPGVFHLWNEPAIGISSQGYIIVRPEGVVAFDAPTWFSDDALRFIEGLGGVRVAAASHQHVYGGLWQLAERFAPDVVIHEADLPMAQALGVSWPFDDHVELLPGVHLHHTGGHTPGHAVLHLPEERVLFCGDALKFKLDDEGRAVAASTHRAYDAHIPIAHADARRYRARFERLDFDAVLTPWEHVPSGGKAAALALYTTLLEGRPSADWFGFSDLGLDGAPADEAHAEPEPVRLYRRYAGEEPVQAFPITSLDRTGVPVWNAMQWMTDGYVPNSTGYGATDEAAQIGAWGELVERIAVHRSARAMRPRMASFEELRREGTPALDPLRLRLPVGTDYAPDRPIGWVEARRVPSGEPVLVPLEEAASCWADLPDADYDALYPPITNGLGAGASFERAFAHGLLELVQRDGNSVTYRAMDQGIVVDVDSVRDAGIREVLERYERAGLAVQVKLAETPLGMPSFYVVGYERDLADVPYPLMLTGCGEGAHPDREVALAKALREFAASRVRKLFNHGPLDRLEPAAGADYVRRVRAATIPPDEDRAFEAMRRWLSLSAEALFREIRDPVFRERRRVRLSALPTVAPGTLQAPADVLACVMGRLGDEGLDAYALDLTPPESAVRVVKALVPELEVETMTYDRIGPRNVRRLITMDHGLAGLGAPPLGAQRVPLTAEQEEALGGPAWFDAERARAVVGPLYPLYREPARHVIALHAEREPAPAA